MLNSANVIKRYYYSSYFSQNSKNIRNIWQGIRDYLKTSSSAKPIFLEIDSTVTSDISFFQNVVDTIRSSIPESSSDFPEYLHDPNRNLIIPTPATPEEISNLIKAMPISKSSGPNTILTKILKLVTAKISIASAGLVFDWETSFFKSFQSDTRFKKASSLDPSNHRLISLLSSINLKNLCTQESFYFLNLTVLSFL